MTASKNHIWPQHVAAQHPENEGVACNVVNEVALQQEIDTLTRLMPGEPVMSEHELSALLKKDLKTIQNRRLVNPESLPPFVQIPGQRGVVYMRHDVIRYLATLAVSARGRRVHRL